MNNDVVTLSTVLLGTLTLAAVVILGLVGTYTVRALLDVVAARRHRTMKAKALRAVWGSASTQH